MYTSNISKYDRLTQRTPAFWFDNEPQLLTLHLSHNTAVVLPRCSTHSFYSHSLDPQLTDVT